MCSCRVAYPGDEPQTWKLRRCDKPRGHDGSHGVYYGWTGRAEVWS